MSVSSKCYYALRAVYALADHTGPEPLKIAEIAEREQIPIRFLEVILNQLKGGGFVQSRRGAEGGYRLARPADQLTVGEIMRYVDGPIAPVDCVSQTARKSASSPAAAIFTPSGRASARPSPMSSTRPRSPTWSARAMNAAAAMSATGSSENSQSPKGDSLIAGYA